MELTFVPQYNGETPRKRRLAKACDACRARKKRCHHHPLDIEGNEQPAETALRPPSSSAFQSISVRKGNSHRFMSDLSPETRLLERTTADGEHGLAKSMDSVGIWVNKVEYESLVRERNAAKAATKPEGNEPDPIQLTTAQIDGLVDVYFQKIQPFLPLLEEDEFRRARSAGALPEPLIHAVCLVAAKDNDALQYFAAMEPDFPRQLCKALHTSVKAGIPTLPKHDKINLICVLALLSLHVEGSDGNEDASLFLVTAMRHCQILGLHLSASFPARNGKHTKRLFWCLWILDRFNAAMRGHPIMMAHNDFAIEQYQSGESGFPAFEVFLKITDILDGVIDFYRPGNPPTTTGWEDRFPGFEEIIDGVRGWSIPAGLLSTLHITYLSVTILSHRSKGAADFASTTPSYVRQSLAAIQIIRLMSPARLASLHASPILPYAIALALSVSYQHLRQDQLLHQQEDARADFEACFVILRELRKTWSSADAMSTLSEKVIDELSRVSSLSSFRIKRPVHHDQQIAGFASACKHNGEAVGFSHTSEAAARPLPITDRNMLVQDMQQLYTPTGTDKDDDAGPGIFAGIDDIFGTYLDPNYPVNLDCLYDLGNLDTTEWSAID